MGSLIHLTLGRVQLDTGKNEGFENHAALFLLKHRTQIPYYYAGDAGKKKYAHLPLIKVSDDFSYRLITEMKEGYSAPLAVVGARLSLLGFTEAFCRREFEVLRDSDYAAEHDFTFEEIKMILQTADFSAAAINPEKGSDLLAEFLEEEVLPAMGPKFAGRLDCSSYQEAIDGLSTHATLYLLSSNPTAQDLPVTWQYADVAESGYVRPESFDPVVPQSSRYLIVTEGSSDVQIIRRALELLRPDLADFFDFVDMQDNYPFSGTGNLYNFVRGLISIRIQNKALIVFDNDAEGVFNSERCARLNKLANMRIVRLPDMDRFKQFATLGPSGTHVADINGKAAAIECYLDVGQSPAVRWTNYEQKRDTYQGHITNKEELAKAFLAQTTKAPGYDYAGLEAILNLIITSCASLTSDVRLAALADWYVVE